MFLVNLAARGGEPLVPLFSRRLARGYASASAGASSHGRERHSRSRPSYDDDEWCLAGAKFSWYKILWKGPPNVMVPLRRQLVRALERFGALAEASTIVSVFLKMDRIKLNSKNHGGPRLTTWLAVSDDGSTDGADASLGAGGYAEPDGSASLGDATTGRLAEAARRDDEVQLRHQPVDAERIPPLRSGHWFEVVQSSLPPSSGGAVHGQGGRCRSENASLASASQFSLRCVEEDSSSASLGYCCEVCGGGGGGHTSCTDESGAAVDFGAESATSGDRMLSLLTSWVNARCCRCASPALRVVKARRLFEPLLDVARALNGEMYARTYVSHQDLWASRANLSAVEVTGLALDLLRSLTPSASRHMTTCGQLGSVSSPAPAAPGQRTQHTQRAQYDSSVEAAASEIRSEIFLWRGRALVSAAHAWAHDVLHPDVEDCLIAAGWANFSTMFAEALEILRHDMWWTDDDTWTRLSNDSGGTLFAAPSPVASEFSLPVLNFLGEDEGGDYLAEAAAEGPNTTSPPWARAGGAFHHVADHGWRGPQHHFTTMGTGKCSVAEREGARAAARAECWFCIGTVHRPRSRRGESAAAARARARAWETMSAGLMSQDEYQLSDGCSTTLAVFSFSAALSAMASRGLASTAVYADALKDYGKALSDLYSLRDDMMDINPALLSRAREANVVLARARDACGRLWGPAHPRTLNCRRLLNQHEDESDSADDAESVSSSDSVLVSYVGEV